MVNQPAKLKNLCNYTTDLTTAINHGSGYDENMFHSSSNVTNRKLPGKKTCFHLQTLLKKQTKKQQLLKHLLCEDRCEFRSHFYILVFSLCLVTQHINHTALPQ